MYDFLQKYIAMKSTKLIRSEYPQSANAKIGLNLSIPIALIIKHLNYNIALFNPTLNESESRHNQL
jgi:hypothetical protein